MAFINEKRVDDKIECGNAEIIKKIT